MQTSKKANTSSVALNQNVVAKTSQDNIDVPISEATIKKHLYTLASDEMEGRATGKPSIERAAQYIEGEFKRIGLSTYNDLPTYRQNFEEQGVKMFNVIGVLGGKVKKTNFLWFLRTMTTSELRKAEKIEFTMEQMTTHQELQEC